MTVTIHGSYRQMTIEGVIERGDFGRFEKVVQEHQAQISTVHLFSPGGDFEEAMKIGRAIRALELSTRVPMAASGRPRCESGGLADPKPRDPANCTCASACFLLHAAGVHRGGTYIAVHRPYFDKRTFAALSEEEARRAFAALQASARDYMNEMGVPAHVQEEVLGTPSERSVLLDERTVKTHFWLHLPYRHEWLRAKCSSLSAAEAARSGHYGEILLKTDVPLRSVLTREEYDDYVALRDREMADGGCSIALVRASREAAHERYFGEKPNDHSRHNYARWTDAASYLGKRYDELLGEEAWKEERFAGSVSLGRPATATSPAMSLLASRSQARVVATVIVISGPNPTQEFSDKLIKQLDGAWGKPTSSGPSEWLWLHDRFTATLKESTAAEGPFMSLAITDGR